MSGLPEAHQSDVRSKPEWLPIPRLVLARGNDRLCLAAFQFLEEGDEGVEGELLGAHRLFQSTALQSGSDVVAAVQAPQRRP